MFCYVKREKKTAKISVISYKIEFIFLCCYLHIFSQICENNKTTQPKYDRPRETQCGIDGNQRQANQRTGGKTGRHVGGPPECVAAHEVSPAGNI